jgi:hypothetical protein
MPEFPRSGLTGSSWFARKIKHGCSILLTQFAQHH